MIIRDDKVVHTTRAKLIIFVQFNDRMVIYKYIIQINGYDFIIAYYHNLFAGIQ